MVLTKDFGFKSSFKVLYCTFVWPILEYGAVIWDPHTAENSRQLERVHRRFFGFTSSFLPLVCDYHPVVSLLGLLPLAEHKRFFGDEFLKYLISG